MPSARFPLFHCACLVGLLGTLILCLPTRAQSPGDWATWRGNSPATAGSISFDKSGNTLTDTAGKAWTAELPGRGCSTPVKRGKAIYVTCPNRDQEDSLLCFDDAGNQQWQIAFGPQDAGRHRNGSGSNASPVFDTGQIYVYFKSGNFAAVDYQGNKVWQKNLVDDFGPVNLFWSHGTSPVLTSNHIVMARIHEGESWLAAFSKSDGRLIWKTDRQFQTPRECDNGYGTPVVIDYQGQESLLTYGAEQLTIHRASDGQLLFTRGGFNPQQVSFWPTIASPIVIGDTAVVASGRADRRQPHLHGIKLTTGNKDQSTDHLWDREDIGTFVPSPAIYQGHVLLLSDIGAVELIDPQTGKAKWRHDFPKKGKRHFYGSPLIVENRLYAVREDGLLFTADISDSGLENVLETKLGQSIIASPIPIDQKRVLFRGEKDLICISQ